MDNLESLDLWNPMEDDYNNRRVNSYREGVGQDLQYNGTADEARFVYFL